MLVQLGDYLNEMVRKRNGEEPFLVIFEESIRFLVKNSNYGILLYSGEGRGQANEYVTERRERIRVNFRAVAEDYFTRCGVPKKKYNDIFDAVNAILNGLIPVSYTHLDVYKRQGYKLRNTTETSDNEIAECSAGTAIP